MYRLILHRIVAQIMLVTLTCCGLPQVTAMTVKQDHKGVCDVGSTGGAWWQQEAHKGGAALSCALHWPASLILLA